MQSRLYTIHTKRDLEPWPVADRFSWLALLLPPVWAIWHGLWLVLVFVLGLLVLAALWSPAAVVPAWLSIAAILGFEGGAVTRGELALRGWDEEGVVEARSEEGAEELFLRGATL